MAISNHRLVSLDDDQVQFRWKDYARGNRPRVMTLAAVEFIRRFLLHVLPKGFVRIRQYGLLANRCRSEDLARCRELLGGDDKGDGGLADSIGALTDDGQEPTCPVCGKGTMMRVAVIAGPLRKRRRNRAPPILDSS